MLCPNCKHTESCVVDSRAAEDNISIRRRRKCQKCGHRFTTYERVQEAPLMVLKKNGTVQPFEREKVLKSLLTATAKRGIALEKLENLVDKIEHNLQNVYKKNNVPSSVLGDEILMQLGSIDSVAYVRFASVYKDFKDLEEFNAELKRIAQSKNE